MLTLPAALQDQGVIPLPFPATLPPLLSYVRDNHLRLHLSFALLSALVLSCEKCILPQFVALAVRCRLPTKGLRGGSGVERQAVHVCCDASCKLQALVAMF